jgi:hypothetical protein
MDIILAENLLTIDAQNVSPKNLVVGGLVFAPDLGDASTIGNRLDKSTDH